LGTPLTLIKLMCWKDYLLNHFK